MKILTFVLFISILPELSFSQSLDSLITGKTYKVTLFDEKEITGVLISRNDSTISLKNNNVTSTVYKKDIFSATNDTSPSKYKFLASLNSGFVTNDYYLGYYSNFIINGRFSYFFSDKKNVGADISFISFSDNTYDYYDYPASSYYGGKQYFIDIMVNAQIGTFDKNNIVDLYVNFGAGIHISSRTSSSVTYYSFYNSDYFTVSNPSSTRVYPLLQIGGGLIIKPAYNFGINLEIDIEAYEFGYIVIPTEAYFPLKAGVSYYFMK